MYKRYPHSDPTTQWLSTCSRKYESSNGASLIPHLLGLGSKPKILNPHITHKGEKSCIVIILRISSHEHAIYISISHDDIIMNSINMHDNHKSDIWVYVNWV